MRERARDVLFARAGGLGGNVAQRAQRQRILIAGRQPDRSRAEPLDQARCRSAARGNRATATAGAMARTCGTFTAASSARLAPSDAPTIAI